MTAKKTIFTPADPFQETEAPQAVEVPPKEDTESLLLKELKAMKEELEKLKAASGETARKVNATYDETDDRVFLAKPHGNRWTERRVIDKRLTEIEFTETSFFGPFDSEEQAEAYVKTKSSQRDGADANWANVYVIKGRDARLLRQREKEERENSQNGSLATNVLDRKLFAAPTFSAPQTGQLVSAG
jgi:hypothetical protein